MSSTNQPSKHSTGNDLSLATSSKRLLQNHDTLFMWIQRLINAAIIVVTLLGLAWWRDGDIGPHYRYMAIISVLTTLVVYHLFGVHRRFETTIGGIQHLARAWGVVIIIVGWVGFLSKTTEDYSRQVIFLWVISAFVLQASIYPAIYWFNKWQQRKAGSRQLPSVIIGTGAIAQYLSARINKNVWLPDQIIGAIALSKDNEENWNEDIPILGDIEQLDSIVRDQHIRRIYVAIPLQQTQLIENFLNMPCSTNVDIIWAPDIFSLHLLNPSVREMAGVPLVTLSETPLVAGGPAFIKDLMDKTFSTAGLILLSPLLLIVACLIKFTSTGPVIFKQKRHGWDGELIEVWKFRSMYEHEVEAGKIKQAVVDDPRITPVGRLIRRTSIDELPQLFNVLQGKMSLVGPRPHAVEHNEYYSNKLGVYLKRHRIKPGITGLAQIHGYRGETETLEKMEQRIEYDLEYINNWSPWLDFKILLKTPFALISGNAY